MVRPILMLLSSRVMILKLIVVPWWAQGLSARLRRNIKLMILVVLILVTRDLRSSPRATYENNHLLGFYFLIFLLNRGRRGVG